MDTGPTKVGCHREISDRCNHGDCCSDVVEDTLLARLGEGQTHEGKGGYHHDSGHSPVPVGSMGGEVVVCDNGLALRAEAVDSERLIACRHFGGGVEGVVNGCE